MGRLRKKLTISLCSAALLAAVSVTAVGCGSGQSLQIEDAVWQMSTVQSAEGPIIVCTPEMAELLDGNFKTMELTCTAENGILTLTNEETGERYQGGTYEKQKTTQDGTLYLIAFPGEEDGMGTVTQTVYEDGTAENTMVWAVDGKAIYFESAE